MKVFKKEKWALNDNMHRYTDEHCDDKLPPDQRISEKERSEIWGHLALNPKPFFERLKDLIPSPPKTVGPWVVIPIAGGNRTIVFVPF